MTLSRTLNALLPADAVVAFEWVDHETAIVRATSVDGLDGETITVREDAVTQHADLLIVRERVYALLSSALTYRLPWTAAAVAVLRVPATAEAPAFGALFLWRESSSAPHAIPLALQQVMRDLIGSMLIADRRHEGADLLTHVLRTLPDAVVFLSMGSHDCTINAGAARLLDLSEGNVPGAMVAMRMRDLGRRVVNRDAYDSLARQLAGASSDDIAEVLWEIGGATSQFLRVSAINAMAGARSGWLWTFRDVTAEERAVRDARDQEQERERVHQFLESMLDAMDDSVVACDASGALFLMNAAAKRRHGMPDMPTLQQPRAAWLETLGVRERRSPAPEALPLLRALQGEHVDDAELCLTGRDETEIELLVSARPVRRQDGSLLGAVAVGRDITQRRVAEQKRAPRSAWSRSAAWRLA